MSFNLARGSDALRQATVPAPAAIPTNYGLSRLGIISYGDPQLACRRDEHVSVKAGDVRHELGGRRAIGRHANGGVSRNPRAGLQHLEFSGRSEGIEDPLRAMQTRVAPWSCWPFLQGVLLVS